MEFFLLLTVFTSGFEGKLLADTIKTFEGNIVIVCVGHGSLMFKFKGMVIYVDPFSRIYDYSKLPSADIIFITHHHRDHLDPEAIKMVKKENTKIIITEKCVEQIKDGIIIKNGEVKIMDGLKIETIPAYNIVHKRENGKPFHIKGEGNGYVITFGDKKVYIAGDTENIPEMKELKNIDIAFLPMNLPYTMTPEMVVDAVKSFKPKILYPYHTNKEYVSKFLELMRDGKEVEIRIRGFVSREN